MHLYSAELILTQIPLKKKILPVLRFSTLSDCTFLARLSAQSGQISFASQHRLE